MALKEIIENILEEGEKEKEKIIGEALKEIEKDRAELKKEGRALEEQLLGEIKKKLALEKEKRILALEQEESRLTLQEKMRKIDQVISAAMEEVKSQKEVISKWLKENLLLAVDKGKGEICYPLAWDKYIDSRLKKALQEKAGGKIELKPQETQEIIIIKQGRKETTISLKEFFLSQQEKLRTMLNKILFS
ncbi:MAG: hypothetical protein GXO71_06225 [Caldiserica bacterium]|nr:hypothetical protein [Caldisericota bacterium]